MTIHIQISTLILYLTNSVNMNNSNIMTLDIHKQHNLSIKGAVSREVCLTVRDYNYSFWCNKPHKCDRSHSIKTEQDLKETQRVNRSHTHTRSEKSLTCHCSVMFEVCSRCCSITLSDSFR